MTQIAIVFHSGYGHTARVAEHVAKPSTPTATCPRPPGPR